MLIVCNSSLPIVEASGGIMPTAIQQLEPTEITNAPTGGLPFDSVEPWLAAKGSQRTRDLYRATFASYVTYLATKGLTPLSAPGAVAVEAEGWASAGEAAKATGAHRLAVASSWYSYWINKGAIHANPIKQVDKGNYRVDAYREARPMKAATLQALLRKIPRATATGKRDYAILQVMLQTARRRAEVAALKLGDLADNGDGTLHLVFQHTKGGGTKDDNLAPGPSRALIAYLDAAHGPLWRGLPANTPTWLALDSHKGHALSERSITDVVKRWLGKAAHPHQLRHTVAYEMLMGGSNLADIQRQLGHKSISITGLYVANLDRRGNPAAGMLADKFDVVEEL